MKLLTSVFVTTIAFALIACTSNQPQPNPIVQVGCSVETAVASSLSASIATTLTCANLSSIQADILNVLGKGNLCAQVSVPPAAGEHKAKGVLGNIVCPLAVSSALGLVVSKVPAAWGCDPSKDAGSLSAAMTTACNNVVNF